MSVLPYGVTRILKPIVSFSINALSDLMTAAIFYGLILIAFADRLVPYLFGTN
jgi:hypothetical protein